MTNLADAIRMEADCWLWCRARRRYGHYCDPADPGVRNEYARSFYRAAYDRWARSLPFTASVLRSMEIDCAVR